MPEFRKMTNDEIKDLTTPKRKSELGGIQQEYIEFLKEFKKGDWVSVRLKTGENRLNVKNRIMAASKRLGYALHFSRKNGDIRFQVVETGKKE